MDRLFIQNTHTFLVMSSTNKPPNQCHRRQSKRHKFGQRRIPSLISLRCDLLYFCCLTQLLPSFESTPGVTGTWNQVGDQRIDLTLPQPHFCLSLKGYNTRTRKLGVYIQLIVQVLENALPGDTRPWKTGDGYPGNFEALPSCVLVLVSSGGAVAIGGLTLALTYNQEMIT